MFTHGVALDPMLEALGIACPSDDREL